MRESQERQMQVEKAAHWYVDQRISVIPIELPKPGDPTSGKKPRGQWKLYTLGVPTHREVSALFSVECNIAAITGRVSNLIMVDLDTAEGKRWAEENLPKPPFQILSGRGEAWPYRYPGVEVRPRVGLAEGVDLRGDDSYYLLPPSVHANGKQYRFTEKMSRELFGQLEVFPTEVLAKERKYAESSVSVEIEDRVKLIRRAMSYIDKLEPAVSGHGGHNQTMRAAGILIQRFRLSISEALPIMLSFSARCQPPWDDKSILHKLESAQRNLGE